MSDALDVRDVDAFALAVDARVLSLPEGCDPARLFGVRLRPQGVMLVPLWSGVARDLPPWVVPPPDVAAIALATRGWAAPIEDDGSMLARPSEHPRRRRIHQTAMVTGEGDDVCVLRYDDEPEPVLLRGAVGVVHELLVACWARRPDAAA
jgi:hypothetical protein